MKRIWVMALLLLLVGSTVAFAEKPFFSPLVSLFATSSATGTDSSTENLGSVYGTITCLVSQTGTTTPTQSVFTLKGSIDGTNFKTLKTITSSAWPDIQTTHAVDSIPSRYILATFTSFTGTALTDSKFTLKCLGSH